MVKTRSLESRALNGFCTFLSGSFSCVGDSEILTLPTFTHFTHRETQELHTFGCVNRDLRV